jgi:hypothetical protein
MHALERLGWGRGAGGWFSGEKMGWWRRGNARYRSVSCVVEVAEERGGMRGSCVDIAVLGAGSCRIFDGQVRDSKFGCSSRHHSLHFHALARQ